MSPGVRSQHAHLAGTAQYPEASRLWLFSQGPWILQCHRQLGLREQSWPLSGRGPVSTESLGGQVHAGIALPSGAPEPQMVLETRQGSHRCVARSEARVDGGGECGRTPRDCQPDPPLPRPPRPVLQETQHRRWWPRGQHAARPGAPGLSFLGAENSCSPCVPILVPRGPTPATHQWLC